jgi:RNA polymerase sigma-70 factor (ECF subfamily)
MAGKVTYRAHFFGCGQARSSRSRKAARSSLTQKAPPHAVGAHGNRRLTCSRRLRGSFGLGPATRKTPRTPQATRVPSARPQDRSPLDASDVVQEAFIDAERRLPEFLSERPVGFFTWLKSFAVQRLVSAHRFHLGATKRSAYREVKGESNAAERLIDRLPASWTSVSGLEIRQEQSERLQRATEALSPTDREILVLRYGEGLPFAEISDRLGASVGALKLRHLRAVERLRALLDDAELAGRNG